MRTIHDRLLLLLAVGLLLPAASAPSSAQSALGQGDALDANLNRAGRRNAPSQRLDFRQRNLLVTGDIAAGRGFRGTVGYTAAEDFRGAAGSTDLYRFQSDSALSSLSLLQYGSALQEARYGYDPGGLAYRPATTGSTLSTAMRPRLETDDVFATRQQLERVSLERAAAQQQDRLTEPRVLGLAESEDGSLMALSASSLQGIALTEIERPQIADLPSYDRARLEEDARAGRDVSRLGLPGMADISESLSTALRREDRSAEEMRTRAGEDDYLNVLRRIAQRYADAAGVELDLESATIDELEQQFRDLREQLRTSRPGRPTPPPTEAEVRDTEQPRPEARPEDETEEAEEDQSDEATAERSGIERYGVILRHGEQIEHFAADRDDRFNELMRTAEERLKNSEFFWAERRFDRALRIIPDHPLAMAGMAHAQAGAGLYMPAALTMRRLLTVHPEMIDVRYVEGLLPERQRLFQIVRELQERIDAGIELAEHGFLLAYIGHQLDDRMLVEEGLEQMATAPDDDAFIALLRSVWLGE